MAKERMSELGKEIEEQKKTMEVVLGDKGVAPEAYEQAYKDVDRFREEVADSDIPDEAKEKLLTTVTGFFENIDDMVASLNPEDAEEVKRGFDAFITALDAQLGYLRDDLNRQVVKIDQKLWEEEFKNYKLSFDLSKKIEEEALAKSSIQEQVKTLSLGLNMMFDIYCDTRHPQVKALANDRVEELKKLINGIQDKEGFEKLDTVIARMEVVRKNLDPKRAIDEYTIAMNELLEISTHTANETLQQQVEDTVNEFRNHIEGHELLADMDEYKKAYENGREKLASVSILSGNLEQNSFKQNESLLAANHEAIKYIEDVLPKLHVPAVTESANERIQQLYGDIREAETQMYMAVRDKYYQRRENIGKGSLIERYTDFTGLFNEMLALQTIVTTPEVSELVQDAVDESTEQMMAIKKELGVARIVLAKGPERKNNGS